MIFYHHDLKVELDDAWWAETQMGGFVPPGAAYRVDLGAAKDEAALLEERRANSHP
jgi:hypothetical protein